MVQEKMPASGTRGLDGGLVLLAEALPGGAGQPLAVVSFQDLPDDLRRQLVAGRGRAVVGGVQAVVLTALRGRDAGARDALNIVGHPPVAAPEGGSRHLVGGQAGYGFFPVGHSDGTTGDTSDLRSLFPVGHSDNATGDASDLRALSPVGHSDNASDLRALPLRVAKPPEQSAAREQESEERGRMVYQMDGTAIPHQVRNGLPAWMQRSSGELSSDAAALILRLRALGLGPNGFVPSGAPGPGLSANGFVPSGAPGLGLGANSLVPVGETAALLGDLESAPLFVAPGDAPYAVQVCIDKSGDPIAAGAKITGGLERGHRGGGQVENLSAVLGIITASSAVTAVATGAVAPAAAFGFFAILVVSLSLIMATVRGA